MSDRGYVRQSVADGWLEMTEAGARFNESRTHRYTLWRRWDSSPVIAFIGLNPSTADEFQLDPTVTRCATRAKATGHGGIVMLNLFALRSTDPRGLKEVDDPVGSQNDIAIEAVVCDPGTRTVCVCWGTHGTYLNRHGWLMKRLHEWCPEKLVALSFTKHGYPGHPLYQSYETQFIPFGEWKR